MSVFVFNPNVEECLKGNLNGLNICVKDKVKFNHNGKWLIGKVTKIEECVNAPNLSMKFFHFYIKRWFKIYKVTIPRNGFKEIIKLYKRDKSNVIYCGK